MGFGLSLILVKNYTKNHRENIESHRVYSISKI